MKQSLRYVLCVSGFIIIFFIAFGKVSYILQHKVHDNDTVGSFYNETGEQMDVLFVGSSHSYRSFSPMALWNQTGIASYNLATPKQSIPCTYYLIKEGIRLQHPKVVVLETYGIRYIKDYDSKAKLHEVVDNIPLNATKIEMMKDFMSETMGFHEQLEFAFPIIKYHSRWNALSPEDITPQKTWIRGFWMEGKIRVQKEPKEVTEEKKIYAKNIEYLDKIIELCEENNMELVLVQAPMANSDYYKTVCSKMNTLKRYAEDKEIPYITLDNEIVLDYSIDFMDEGHLNFIGAEKATEYMGNWLKEHYDLPDHRGETEYAEWEEDYKEYSAAAKKQRKKTLEDKEDSE